MPGTILQNLIFQKKLRLASLCMISVVMMISIALMIGWLMQRNQPVPSPIFSNPLCSLFFFICCVSFLLVTRADTRWHKAGYGLSVIIIIGGLYYLFNSSATPIKHHHEWSIQNIFTNINEGLPGDMLNSSAICFILIALFLLTIHVKTKKQKLPAQWFARITLLIGLFSIIANVNRVNDFDKLFYNFLLSPVGAFNVMLLSLALFFVQADRGVMLLFTGKSSGSTSAKRMIPPATLVPIILGIICVHGLWVKLFSVELGASLFVLFTIIIAVVVILQNSRLLNKSDAEKLEIENALRYNTTLLQNISDAIVSTDGAYNIKSWNKHAEDIYGWKAAEVLGKPIGSILRIEYPYASSDEIMKEMNTSGQWSGEVIHHNKKEERLNVYISGSLLRNAQGEREGLVTVIRDITGSKKVADLVKESELRLKNIIDSYSGPIYAKDMEGRFFLWNSTCEETTGLKLEDVKGKTTRDLYPGASAERTMENDRQVLATGKPVQYEEHVNFPSGLVIDYTVILFPLFNLKNELYGTGGICVDITSRKQLEKNLILFNEQLEKEVKERTNELRHLAAYLNNVREEERINISREIHDELGQQLTVLKMDVSWLDKKLPHKDPHIKDRIDQIIHFINDAILTVRRIASQLRPGVLSDLGLVAAIEWQLNELKKRTGIKNIFLYDDVPDDLPEVVNTGMFRILQESLTNVVRHANASQVIVEIKNERDNHLVLKIQDDGKGFDSSKKPQQTLGLLGMQERAIVMGGKYSISSVPGEGTTILVDVAV
ncbi:MAG: PAS domain S-box protein [Agriterribacter sp.]